MTASSGPAGRAGKLFLAFCLAVLLVSPGEARAAAGASETEEFQAEAGKTDSAAGKEERLWTVPAEKVKEARTLDTSHVADASDMTAVEEPEESGRPVSADMLKDGVYEIGLESSSSMFKVGSVLLTVEDGSMYADLIMDGEGYLYLYPGSAEEAAQADAEDFVYSETDENGKMVFRHFPLEKLGVGVPCAAFSRKKEQWYPRTLVFQPAMLPASAFTDLQGSRVEELSLEDGSWEAELSLEGKGRLKLISPMKIEVKNGKAEGLLVFDSSNYDYIIINGVRYDALEGEEKSSFLIPVEVFDAAIPMTADSVAIKGMQVEQDYLLTVSLPAGAGKAE